MRPRLTDLMRDLWRARLAYMSAIVSPRSVLDAIRRYPSYIQARQAFEALDGAPQLRLRDDFPVLTEGTSTTFFDPHYTYLDGWAARLVAAVMPDEHVDVGSRVSFAVGLSAFVPVAFVDLRPVRLDLEGFHGVAGDLTDLPYPDQSVASLSCLHVIEHVGLGRYGDRLDPRGAQRAASELERILAPGGALLVGVPVGRARVQFNAHRVHDPMHVVAMFPELRLVSFAAVDDNGRFISDASPADFREAKYACGCYHFVRPAM